MDTKELTAFTMRGKLTVYGKPEAIELVKLLLWEHVTTALGDLDEHDMIKDFEGKLFNFKGD